MSINRQVDIQPAHGKQITLADVRDFVAELDKAGATETTLIGARVGFRGQCKSLSATAVRFGDPEPR